MDLDYKITVDLSYAEKVVSKSSSGSKGNQPKWQMGVDWYKGDFMGYEGLSELVVCDFLRHSNVETYAKFFPVEIKCDEKIYSGCMSIDFLNENEILIPIEHLHRLAKGKSLAKTLESIGSTNNKIKYTVDFVEETTGLMNFGEYLTKILELDALFLNEDRHTNNISVIRNTKTKEYRLCAIYDFGLSLMSDLNEYPSVWGNIGAEIRKVKSKPFSSDFKKQRDAARSIYGHQVLFNLPPDIFNSFNANYGLYYDKKLIDRVFKILDYQIEQNKDMFKSHDS